MYKLKFHASKVDNPQAAVFRHADEFVCTAEYAVNITQASISRINEMAVASFDGELCRANLNTLRIKAMSMVYVIVLLAGWHVGKRNGV